MYTGIQNSSAQVKISPNVVRKKQLHIFSCLFVFMLTFACLNLSLISGLGLSDFIKNITGKWTPKTDDIGKIKFVNFSFNNPESPNGVFIVSSPFKNYWATNIDDTCLQVSGLGDMFVLAPITGKVQSVNCKQGQCSIAISYGNVCVQIGGLDYAVASVGAQVNQGDKIGVDSDSLITFKLLCDGQYIALPASGVGDTFFE